MSNLSDFVLEQHRVYLLHSFELRPTGEIVCSGYARSNPEHMITALFPHAVMRASWQDSADSSKLSWPLEVIGFHAIRLGGKRFRFTLNCLDFEREWESEWPQLL